MRLIRHLNERLGGQYFTPEEENLFNQHTKEALDALVKMGWEVHKKMPSASGTVYWLWDKGRSRTIYLQ